MTFYFGDLIPYAGDLAIALGLSLGLTTVAMIIGGVFSVFLYLGKASSFKTVSWLCSSYIEIFRNTPLLVQIYLIYFGLAEIGLNFDTITAGLIALSLNNAAYCAEIIRGGFNAVPQGVKEAGEALGLSQRDIFIKVSLPPAVRAVFPSLVNQYIHLFLYSSVASVIGLPELMDTILNINSSIYRTIEVLAVGALLYFVTGFILSVLGRLAERWLFPWAVVSR